MPKKIITTTEAPQAIGPYSQAVQAGPYLFLSGQIALEHDSGEVVAGDVEAQARRVMKNLQAVLNAAGASFEDVVKCTIYLKSMGDFAQVNEIYRTCFATNPPARATVEVSRLPKDVLVEIDAVAYLE